MQVIYNNNSPVRDGEYLKVFETQRPPKIVYNNDHPFYVVIMYDPDAVGGTYLHWIQGSDFTTYLSYKGPAPPPNTGDHHYIFELYIKPKDFDPKVKERSIQKNIEDSKMEWGLLGKPLQSVSFIVQSPTSGGKKSGKERNNKIRKDSTKKRRTSRTSRTRRKNKRSTRHHRHFSNLSMA